MSSSIIRILTLIIQVFMAQVVCGIRCQPADSWKVIHGGEREAPNIMKVIELHQTATMRWNIELAIVVSQICDRASDPTLDMMETLPVILISITHRCPVGTILVWMFKETLAETSQGAKSLVEWSKVATGPTVRVIFRGFDLHFWKNFEVTSIEGGKCETLWIIL
jgi:hypothetical protein